jgi:mannose-6-phosphate isomerase
MEDDIIRRPVALGPNQPDTFYRGAGRIGRFRQMVTEPRPEDWVASTTTRFGQPRAGLTELAPGLLLVDAIAADPAGWLGTATDAGLLVKLLDAGERLPVHVHPDGDFAQSHLGLPCGKTEAWIVLEAEPGASVRLGFSRDVSSTELSTWVRDQDVDALLDVTNEVGVAVGDAILCPAGMPHAIGAGVLLVELQEPSDLSVLLEWRGFPLSSDDAFLGLPPELALACVDRSACTPARIEELRTPAPDSLLPAEAARYFRAERLVSGAIDTGFSVVIITGGVGMLYGEWGDLPLSSGNTIVIPAAAGACTVTGDAVGIRCRPAR